MNDRQTYGTPLAWYAGIDSYDDVVALVCASDFPDPQLVVDVVASGVARGEPIKWVCRDRDLIAKAALLRNEIEPIFAKLNPAYAGEEFDRRSEVREEEIMRISDRVLLFKTPTTQTLNGFTSERMQLVWPDKTKVIERGAAAKKKYAKRKKGE